MTHSPEDILDSEIKQLSQQPGFQSAQDAQNAQLLEIARMLSELPTHTAPTPAMQRKYLFVGAQTENFWEHLFLHRHAAALLSLAILFTLGGATAYSAVTSVPGERLFTLKKGAEQLRVKMTTDEVSKASLQMAITKKRFEEAEKIFSNPGQDPQLEIAALEELSAQTESAVKQVETAAKQSKLTEKNHPVIVSLEEITKRQQTLLSQLEPQNEVKAAAATALVASKQNENKVAQIKTIVDIAIASNEQILASLQTSSDVIEVSGVVSELASEKITVEKYNIIVTAETVVQNSRLKSIGITDIATGSKVSIIATAGKEDNILTASKIVVVLDEPQPQVKGATATGTTETVIAKPSSTSTIPNQKTIPAEKELPELEPNTALGSFIPEDPAPQFTP